MKKALVLLALATSGLAIAADAPAAAPQQAPAQTQPAKPVEPKKSFVAATEEQQLPQKPVNQEKPKTLLVAEQKCPTCPEKKETTGDKKEETKPAAKTAAPKIALA